MNCEYTQMMMKKDGINQCQRWCWNQWINRVDDADLNFQFLLCVFWYSSFFPPDFLSFYLGQIVTSG